jgi:uroporphyrinogen decarboxylase
MLVRHTLAVRAHAAFAEGRRLVAPLMGFPGLRLTGCNIKLAQQNYGEHYRVIKALAQRFSPDMMFPLMDLAVEANALGRYTVFPTDDSATVLRGRFTMDELAVRRRINIGFDSRLLGYVETVKLMSIGLPDSMLRGAYVTGPYSLAALIMGADDAALATITDPLLLTDLCQLCTEKIEEYARLLVAAGAQVICILEPSAVMLGPEQFQQFSAEYVAHITDSCRYAGLATIYHTCGNTMHLIRAMARTGVDGISLDSRAAGVDLPEAARLVGADTVVIGNINPTGLILTGTPSQTAAETEALLGSMDPYPNFILSTGCDLPQETPVDNIKAFVDAGREHAVSA